MSHERPKTMLRTCPEHGLGTRETRQACIGCKVMHAINEALVTVAQDWQDYMQEFEAALELAELTIATQDHIIAHQQKQLARPRAEGR